MRHLLLISAALALSASAVMACPYGKKNMESTTAPVEKPQSTASAETAKQSEPVQVASGEKDDAATVAK